MPRVRRAEEEAAAAAAAAAAEEAAVAAEAEAAERTIGANQHAGEMPTSGGANVDENTDYIEGNGANGEFDREAQDWWSAQQRQSDDAPMGSLDKENQGDPQPSRDREYSPAEKDWWSQQHNHAGEGGGSSPGGFDENAKSAAAPFPHALADVAPGNVLGGNITEEGKSS
jgi:hypothetical protein